VTTPPPDLELFATTAPGLEPVCAAELADLGISGETVSGGVAWRAGQRSLYRANLELRTASRVLVRLGSFRARTFHELERRVPRLPWARYVLPGGAVLLRVTARKSKLYHEGAVAERIGRLLQAEYGTRVDVTRGEGEDDVAESQLVIVRLVRDVCAISVDASGALLHQRGYRQALAKAPVRETVAAALVLVSGWRPGTPLVDPLCGSGTIAIEAALLARRIAPGLASPGHAPRGFAFERWPDFDAALWDDVVAAARSRIERSSARVILGSDRNAGAIRAATANAARAGVGDDVMLEIRPLAAFAPPPGTGTVVTNPPYGVRVGERRALGELYAELGRVVRERASGWCLALLSADPRLDARVGIALEERVRTRNGGIAVRMLAGTVSGRGGTACEPQDRTESAPP
jgi:putative N6-adenine-specific DNA methylase